MIAAIDGFLKPLDRRLRVSMSVAFAALGSAIAAYGLFKASLGPWFLAAISGVACAAAVWMSQRVWPDKVSPSFDAALEKWKAARGKATKTPNSRFVWGLGRSAVGAFVASHAMDWVPGASSELTAAAMLGFGVSFGFFGLEAAIWGMLVVGVAFHAAVSYGVGVDLSDANSRRAFMEAWRAGATISWFWAFAFGLVPFAWIGISATIGQAKKSIVRNIKRRKDAASAQKRIDARRLRMSGAPGVAGDTALDKARAQLEEAKNRLRSLGKGGTIIDGSDAEASAEGGKELTGVEKLENDNMIGTLRAYAAQVASIRQVEAQGLAVDTPARRGFDRVIMAMADTFIEHLRKDQSPSSKDLLSYYLGLCEGEDAALRGSDGEIVTSVSVLPSYDEEDDIDAMSSGSSWNVQSAPEDIGVLGDVMDEEEDEIDVPPPSSPPAPAPVAAEPSFVPASRFEPDGPAEPDLPPEVVEDGADDVVERFSDEVVEEPRMMLAPSSSEPFDVMDEGGPLPLADDVDEDETSSMAQENVADPEVLQDDRDDVADHGVAGPTADAVVQKAAAVVEGGSLDEVGRRSDDEGNPVSALSEPSGPSEPEASELTGGDNVEEDIVEGPGAAERKAAATKILMMRTPRDLIVSTAGWFSGTADIASAMGIDDDDFDEPFDAYNAKVVAYGLENELRSFLRIAASEEDAVRLDDAARVLIDAGWDHDRDLVEEAARVAHDLREAARIRREEEEARLRLEEQQRQERAEAERLRVEKEAEEAAQAARAIAEAQEAERLRKEEDARRIAAEAAAAERSRQLEERRLKIAVQIMLGRLTDVVVEDGMELFENAESLGEALDVDIETATEHYDRFASARDAKLKYRELVAAFRAEDVSVVEALLRDESSFEGYSPADGISIPDIRKWVEGVRVRERLHGLVDGDRDVVETGGGTRRRFMMKRTGVTDEMAAIIDELIPRELRVVISLNDAIRNMGGNAPELLHISIAQAKARAAVLARTLLDNTDPKVKIGEYAAAYLPMEVRKEGQDVWEMLVGMAAEAPVPEADAASPATPLSADVPPPPIGESAPVAEPVSAPSVVQEAESVVPDRIRVSTPIGLKPPKTFAEVSKLNPEKEVAKIPKGSFNEESFFNQQRMALRGYLGNRTDELVRIEDAMIYSSILGPSGSVIGRVRIQAKDMAFAWYEHPEAVWFKDSKTGEMKKVKTETVERQAGPYMNAPNGDPETVIGFVLMSSLVTQDGLTSATPFIEKMGPRYVILNMNDSDGLCSFMRKIGGM